MKILHISDTHGQHNRLRNLPEADVLVHSGDFSFDGSQQEVIDFLNWFVALPYKHKIFVTGNLDMCLEDGTVDGLPQNCHDLRYESVIIEGVKFHGIPMFMGRCVSGYNDWAIKQIPGDTDILVSHTPPLGILDFDDNILYGSKELLTKVEKIKPRYHLFGHIHANNGIATQGSTTFVNSAVVNTIYSDLQPWHLLEIQPYALKL